NFALPESASDDDAAKAAEAFGIIQQVLQRVYTDTGNILLVQQLIPLGMFVSCTATGSVSQWRSWLTSQPSCYESAWLRRQLYKHLKDAVPPLVAGCASADKLVDAYVSANNL